MSVKTVENQEKTTNVDCGVNSSFAYEGTIKVSIMKGKKVYSTKTFKNNGRYPLFHFLTECLRGQYQDAEPLRPKFINIYNCPTLTIGESKPPEIKDGGAKIDEYAKESNKLNLVSYTFNTAPGIEVAEKEIGSSKITYKFLIPFTHLDTASKRPAMLVCLNSTSNFKTYGNPSVFFFVTDSNGYIDSLVDMNSYNVKNTEYNLFIE